MSKYYLLGIKIDRKYLCITLQSGDFLWTFHSSSVRDSIFRISQGEDETRFTVFCTASVYSWSERVGNGF